MKRLVLGTSALGSSVAPATARKVLRAACDAGVRRIDTAPFYGAGYAPGLVASLGRGDIRASTKFGSPREPLLRYLAKRALRSSAFETALENWPPLYRNSSRAGQQWWALENQRRAISFATRPLAKLGHEHLFLHSPPVVPAASSIESLQREAQLHGWRLGVCSPRLEDLRAWLELRDFLGCYQVHLDLVSRLAPADLSALLKNEVWIHGIYSPVPGSRLALKHEREAFCVELAARCGSAHFVVGAKSEESIKRLAEFGRKLH